MEAKTLTYTLPDTLAGKKAKILIDTLVNVKAKTQVFALFKALPDVEAEELTDTLFKVTAEALVRG